MLLKIYLGTTLVSIITSVTSVACNKKLERDGYKFVKHDESISEKLFGYMSLAFKSVLPVYNIVYSLDG